MKKENKNPAEEMKNRLVIHAKRKDVNSEQSMVKNGMIT
jgi:hypothetical protein